MEEHGYGGGYLTGYEEALWSQAQVGFMRVHEHACVVLEAYPGVVRHDYVERHIIMVLCPARLCGRHRSFRMQADQGSAETGHITITASRAGVVRNPPAELGGSAARRGLLGPGVDFGVSVGRGETCMAQPPSDDVDLDAGLHKVNGSGVSEDVGADPASCRRVMETRAVAAPIL